MIRYALINDNEVKEIAIVETEEEILPYLSRFQNVLESANAQKGWLFNGARVFPAVDAASLDFVLSQVYDPLVVEFENIRRKFIGENIFWNIDQLNKTKAVADFMEPIEKWFNRYSPKQTLEEIEKAKILLNSDPVLAANLAPFITIDRLTWYATSILTALAKIKGN